MALIGLNLPDIGPDPNPNLKSTYEALALRCFRSDKLSVRRYGLEQIGQIARNSALGQTALTEWIKEERVLEDLFGERLDDRVVEVAEVVLKKLKHSEATVDVMLSRLDRTAVQNLIVEVKL